MGPEVVLRRPLPPTVTCGPVVTTVTGCRVVVWAAVMGVSSRLSSPESLRGWMSIQSMSSAAPMSMLGTVESAIDIPITLPRSSKTSLLLLKSIRSGH